MTVSFSVFDILRLVLFPGPRVERGAFMPSFNTKKKKFLLDYDKFFPEHQNWEAPCAALLESMYFT